MFLLFALCISKILEACPDSSPITTDCDITGINYTQVVLTTTFRQFTIPTTFRIQIKESVFHNFQSIQPNVAVLSISGSSTASVLIETCEFNDNTLAFSLLKISDVQSEIVGSKFAHNQITGADMIDFSSSPSSLRSCSFISNRIVGGKQVTLDTSSYSLISLHRQATMKIEQCCFLLSNQINSEFAISIDDGSHASISSNSIFNCDLSRVFKTSDNVIAEKLVAYDPTTLFSHNQCSILDDNTTTPAPADPSEDKDKLITKYLYIAIGSLAGIIFVGIIILVILRMNGKCKKLEAKGSDDLANDEKRTSYLLHEEGQEVPEVEL